MGGPRTEKVRLRLGHCSVLALAALVLALAGCGSSVKRSSSSASTPSSQPALTAIGAGLRGAQGLRATVYARGPATTSAFALDRTGRLWLTAAGLETACHDGVYVIAKAGAKAVKVVSGLKDPLGLVWDDEKLYVASVGRVDEYSGFDGRRFDEHREILEGPVAEGENNLLVVAPTGV